MLAGIPIEAVLFALTLLAVAIFHHRTLEVALIGLAAITGWKLAVTGFKGGAGFTGLSHHMAHEWVILANLFLLLISFALLARHFEQSGIPDAIPAILPNGWTGGVALLVLIFLASGVLDNIAAALIGGTIARRVFRDKVHLGYIAAIVAAANGGGAGSVLGDTTTTMMWIAGVSPLVVLEAYLAAAVALLVVAVPAARAQHQFQPISAEPAPGVVIDWARLGVVGLILSTAIATNIASTLYAPQLLEKLPVLGLAVFGAVCVCGVLRRPDWGVLPEAAKGATFLLALVGAASLMPVEQLPKATWVTTLGLGFLSAVFDNIPLTALALKQGGYDWGFLAYAVGFGGSMMWFGSSAGVAIAGLFPQARSVSGWLRAGWFVPIGYVAGFAALLAVLGWHPN
jgi:Na+/H+ antiporter NhaD/arsenite permease-like protein